MARKTRGIARHVLTAKRLLAHSLIDEPGLLGVGIEAGQNDQPVLLVLLDEEASEARSAIPATFRGIPVAVRLSSRPKKRPAGD